MCPAGIPAELNGAVAAIRRWAQGKPSVRSVFVFGSRLRGTHRPDSDLDVAVAFDVPSGEEPDIFWIDHKRHWEQELTDDVGLSVDLDIAQPDLAPIVWSYLQASSVKVYNRAQS